MKILRLSLALSFLLVCAGGLQAQEWQSTDNASLSVAERMKTADYEVSILRNGAWEPLEVRGALVSNIDIREANWQDTLGHTRTRMGFCMFTDEFRHGARLRVRRQGQAFRQVEIRPTDYKIPYKRIDGQTIELTLRNPGQKVSIEYDGDRGHNLFLIPDKPDRDIPSEGNGIRYFGPGEHHVGDLQLNSGETVYVDEGATLYAHITAKDATGIRIAGRGIISGSDMSHNVNHRTNMLYFSHCRDIQIEDVMFLDSPAWTLHFSDCENLLLDNVKEICWMVNSDGIDLCNVRHAEIRDCFMRNYDDNISLKNFKVDHPGADLYDISLHDCTFWADCAHNLLVGPESKPDLEMRDIRFQNVRILEGRETAAPWLGTIAVMVSDDGNFHDVLFRNITIDHIRGGRIFAVEFCKYLGIGLSAGDIRIENIKYTGDKPDFSYISGLDEQHPIEGITLKNVKVNGIRLTKDNLSEYVQTNAFINNLKVK